MSKIFSGPLTATIMIALLLTVFGGSVKSQSAASQRLVLAQTYTDHAIVKLVSPTDPGSAITVADIPYPQGWGGSYNLSPDGRTVAYTATCADPGGSSLRTDLYVLNLETRNSLLIAKAVDPRTPLLWDSTSTFLTYKQAAGSEVGIVVTNITQMADSATVITEGDTIIWPLAWTARRQLVYYTSNEQNVHSIRLIDTDSGRDNVVFEFPAGTNAVRDFTLSPDRSLVLYQVVGVEGYTLAVLDLSTLQVHPLVSSDEELYEPIWRNDNSIAFTRPSLARSQSLSSRVGRPIALHSPQRPANGTSADNSASAGAIDIVESFEASGRYSVLRRFHRTGPDEYLLADTKTKELVDLSKSSPIVIIGWTNTIPRR